MVPAHPSIPDGEKFVDMFIRFDTIHERDGRTDTQTHTPTHTHAA